MSEESVSVREFARRQDVSESVVRRRWLPAGMPVEEDERGRLTIPVELAESWLEGYDAATAELDEEDEAGEVDVDDEEGLDEDDDDDEDADEEE